jgi:outer membrane protein assembly factor BamB
MRQAGFIGRCIAALLVLGGFPRSGWTADWPTWRGDAGRTAYTSDALSDKLHLQWVRRLPPQVPAWKDEEAMQFDRSYEPVVAGDTLFLGSTLNDSVTAYDLGSGAEKWRFYTDGPVRVTPAVWKDRLLVVSDDGCLYCLGAADGKLQWRFRGGPRDRRLLGNERLISAWPARGGPAVADGTVYFAVGVWPFMGTFVHALDIQSSRLVWTNDSTSFPWRRLPHPGAVGFSGLSPQGHLAVAGDRLIVPGARSQAGVFDRTTGEFLFFGEGQGPEVSVQGRIAVAGAETFDVDTGCPVKLEKAVRLGRAVLAPDAWYDSAATLDPKSISLRENKVLVSESTAKDAPKWTKRFFSSTVGKLPAAAAAPWLRAGKRLVVTRSGEVQLLDVSDRDAVPGPVWREKIRGSVSSVAAASGRLIVVTIEGTIYCFGPQAVKARTYELDRPKPLPVNAWSDRAAEILKATGAHEGYCLVLGLRDGGLVESLLRQSKLHVIAVDADPIKILAIRRRLDAAGAYGTRAAAVLADPAAVEIAPYLASLIVSEDAMAAGLDKEPATAQRLFQTLRPYGGAACLPATADALASAASLPGAEVKRSGAWTLLVRNGPLPGAGQWLGQNADAGNARCSRDRLVMTPLGVLWFGNALSNRLILPRHGEGPVEQVCGGRLFIEGSNGLSAADVYTGRFLWTRQFTGLGKLYDSTKHQPGAHSIGSNFFVAPDAVYVAAGESCHVLDPASGRTLKEFQLPLRRGDKRPSAWQFLLVCEDLLIAGSHPIVDEAQWDKKAQVYSPTSSKALVVMDRRSGAVLWTRDAAESFRHYGICAGGGKVFCIDRLAPETLQKAARRGEKPTGTARILALDARTGSVAWQTDEHVGEQLAYSAEHDVLLAGAALRGKEGAPIWEDAAAAKAIWAGKWGPMLRGETIFCQSATAYDLLTGKPKTVKDARGAVVPWKYPRAYGCGPKSAGEYLIAFRSGAAGYCDLKNQSGTGNLGGFRSGCTSNLIAADGVLNAPDYTRTCTCAYSNRSSLALIHDPAAESWTYGAVPAPGRVAYNLSAPGDRRDGDGTLWRATPQLAHLNLVEKPLVATAPATAKRFLHHVSRIQGGEGLPWVAASGLIGIRSAKVPLEGLDARKPIKIRLVFVEPQDAAPGKRVFGVAVNGKQVFQDLDVAKEAGGPWRVLVKEVRDVAPPGRKAASGSLELSFTPKAGEPVLCGVELSQD